MAGVPKKYTRYKLETYPVKKVQDDIIRLHENWNPGTCAMFFGDFGTGKTVLATILFKMLLTRGFKPTEKTMDYPIGWENSIEFLARCKSNIEKAEKHIKNLQRAQLLLLDDLGAERPTSYAIECLYRVLNYRDEQELSTIITTNLSADKLEEVFNSDGGMLGGRLVSRLMGWAEVIELKGKDLRRG